MGTNKNLILIRESRKNKVGSFDERRWDSYLLGGIFAGGGIPLRVSDGAGLFRESENIKYFIINRV